MRSRVDKVDAIGGQDHCLGHELPLPDAGDPLHGIVQSRQMLDIQGRHDVDAGAEQLVHILPALVAAATGNVAVGQFVHQGHGRLAGQDRIGIQFPEGGVPVGDVPPRDDLKPGCELVQRIATVGFHKCDDDIDPERSQPIAFGQHRVGFPRPRNRAQIDVQPSSWSGGCRQWFARRGHHRHG